jgi:hypothetical protein
MLEEKRSNEIEKKLEEELNKLKSLSIELDVFISERRFEEAVKMIELGQQMIKSIYQKLGKKFWRKLKKKL